MNNIDRVVSGAMRAFVTIVASCAAFVVSGCDEIKVEVVENSASIPVTDIKGSTTNCAVVLKAQQGTTYTATVKSEGDWAYFSNKEQSVSDTMATSDKVIYIYFSKNSSGVERSADVEVKFGDGKSFRGSFTQQSYDKTIAFERAWAELPVCRIDGNYVYNTHYGQLGINFNARNYTFCFDPSNRASLWVAYPLHRTHTSGSGDRDNSSFGYDPTVSTSSQANLGIGSYRGWYDRGHQIPAADRKCSQQMMDQTFYSTNMTPQQANFNQKLWATAEAKVRNNTCADTLYVVTGAYFGGVHHSSIDAQTTDRSNNVCPTPTHYYKALLRTSKGNTGMTIDEVKDASELRAIAFWFEHANTGENTSLTQSHCISVSELEEFVGFEFFPMIDDSIEEEVKGNYTPSLWGIN